MIEVDQDVFARLIAPTARLNPYAIYEEYLAQQPIVDSGLGLWFVFGYDDCLTLLRDRRTSVEEHKSLYPSEPHELPTLIQIDPPDHDRLRRMVQIAFTPRRVEALRERAKTLVDTALEQFSTTDEIDIVEELAYPMPLTIISELLGVSEADRPLIREWSTWLARSIDPGVFRTSELSERINRAQTEFLEYMRDLITHRRHRPTDDLLSLLVSVELDGDRLTELELLGLCVLLLVAGHETTVSLIGNGLLALLRNPAQFSILSNSNGMDADRTAVDELLRYDSPVQMTSRIALEDIVLSGATIPKGNIAILLLGSANHDPNVFDNAATLDIETKRATGHLAFGHGIHFCLGAALARAEGETAIAALVRRFPKMQLASEPSLRPTFVLRGCEQLRIRLGS